MFLPAFSVVLIASLVAIVAGVFVGVGDGVPERLSSFFTQRYVRDAAEMLGYDPHHVRQRASVGVAIVVTAIAIGAIVTAVVFG